MGYFVPQTLRNNRRWVLWRLEDGKKKPYSANYNGLASTIKPHTWAYYSRALQVKEYSGDDYNGLGYVFAEGDGLVFIDLDHCIDDSGNFSAFAEEVINLMPKTYMEISQSGNGLHILVKGTIERAYKSDKLEIYAKGRYMAFTGNYLEAAEPAPAQEAINELFKRYSLEPVQPEEIESEPMRDDDETILRRARSGRNGAIFSALWAGDWQEHYKSQSEADLRLIGLLWYYSRNAEQVERLFINSGLGTREKGKRSDYIKRTIERVAAATPARAKERKQRRQSLTDQPEKRTTRRIKA